MVLSDLHVSVVLTAGESFFRTPSTLLVATYKIGRAQALFDTSLNADLALMDIPSLPSTVKREGQTLSEGR